MALEPIASYSTIVRQLDSSPSQTRRFHTLNAASNGRKHHHNSINNNNKSDSFDANSTFDSCLTESCNSNSYYAHDKQFPAQSSQATAFQSSKNHSSNNNNQSARHSDYNYDKPQQTRKKHSFDEDTSMQDALNTSKTVNNYFTLSEVDNSECNSVASSIKPAERSCDKYGFFLDSEDDDCELKGPTTQEVKSIRQREKKWLQMLNNWRYYINFKWEKIRDRCRKGIPHSLRSQAWFYLCGGHIQKRRNPHLFLDLLNKDIPEDVKNDIFKDLHRQFPMHELFADRNGSGQADLFNVLKAFAVYKPKIGYCQAQGPIAAVLLMHMPAEHAFWSLVALSDYYIGGYFIHNLEEIEIHGQMLFAFLKRFSPNAHSLLKRQSIEPVLYMTEWFMCIYSRNLSWPTVLRVWDMFLCEGVTVLFKVGIYLVDVSLRNENTKTCPTMYETIQKLRNIPKHFLAEETLMRGLKHIDLKDADFLREHKIQLKKHRKTKSKN